MTRLIPTTSERLYAAASRYIGITEERDPKEIAKWIRDSSDWLDPDPAETAWCGCFRGQLGMETATGTPRAHYRAASWASWGRAVDITKPDTWQRGDTVVMTRPGGNHVALFDRHEGKFSFCLGGNQNDSVSVAKFLRSKISAVRR